MYFLLSFVLFISRHTVMIKRTRIVTMTANLDLFDSFSHEQGITSVYELTKHVMFGF